MNIKLHCMFCVMFWNCSFDLCTTSSIGPVGNANERNNTVEEAYIPLERFNNKYYYFGANYKVLGNYFQSIQYCNYRGMSLLSVETKEENDFLFETLKNILGNGEYHFWTSGTTLPDSHWVWFATGRPITYTNWSPNQPDNSGNNEKCLEITYTDRDNGIFWNDHVCTIPKYIVCETEELSHITTPKIDVRNVPVE